MKRRAQSHWIYVAKPIERHSYYRLKSDMSLFAPDWRVTHTGDPATEFPDMRRLLEELELEPPPEHWRASTASGCGLFCLVTTLSWTNLGSFRSSSVLFKLAGVNLTGGLRMTSSSFGSSATARLLRPQLATVCRVSDAWKWWRSCMPEGRLTATAIRPGRGAGNRGVLMLPACKIPLSLVPACWPSRNKTAALTGGEYGRSNPTGKSLSLSLSVLCGRVSDTTVETSLPRNGSSSLPERRSGRSSTSAKDDSNMGGEGGGESGSGITLL